ncbi:MAG: sulfite exporter TauE/SafE family protein [Holosporales bacterium]|jgi:uncharacterized membrane protein YfcA|nr:sulfite exporter TauE/SafE family protein [Holosporales bacterium]
MLRLFFPITGLFFDPFLIFSTGLFGGFASGFLCIGCGVIITPVLMELGVPPLIAVSTQLCHAVGTNFTNFLSYNRKRDVDFQLAAYILFGGGLGSVCEWLLIKYSSGSNAVLTKFIYVYASALIIFGFIILFQSVKEWKNRMKKKHISTVMMRRWMLYLPFHRVFLRSRTEMSVIIPISVGFLAGLLVASLGGGNNLFMAPIITYLIGRISPVVHGTTALSGCVITAITAIIYSQSGYCCDIVFVIILFAGAGLGSFIGVKLTYNIKRYYINAISAIVVFLMASRQIFKLIDNSFPIQTQRQADFSKSSLFALVDGNSIGYTLICIALISAIAYILERCMQKLTEKRKK